MCVHASVFETESSIAQASLKLTVTKDNLELLSLLMPPPKCLAPDATALSEAEVEAHLYVDFLFPARVLEV